MDPAADCGSGGRGSPRKAFQMLQDGAGYAARSYAGMEMDSNTESTQKRIIKMMEQNASNRTIKQEEVPLDPDSFFVQSSQESNVCEDLQDSRDALNEKQSAEIIGSTPIPAVEIVETIQHLSVPQLKLNLLHLFNNDAAPPPPPPPLSGQPSPSEQPSSSGSNIEAEKCKRAQNALRQKSYQKKYTQYSQDLKQKMQQEQKRVIGEGRQTPEEVYNKMMETDAETNASECGYKLVAQIQSLSNVMNRNTTQRGQLHRVQIKLRNLIIDQRIVALQELSAQNAMISLSEAASDFCAPT